MRGEDNLCKDTPLKRGLWNPLHLVHCPPPPPSQKNPRAHKIKSALPSEEDKRATTNVQNCLVISFYSLLLSFRLFELKQ